MSRSVVKATPLMNSSSMFVRNLVMLWCRDRFMMLSTSTAAKADMGQSK